MVGIATSLKREGLGAAAASRQPLAEEDAGARQVEMAAGELALEAAQPGAQEPFSLGSLAGCP